MRNQMHSSNSAARIEPGDTSPGVADRSPTMQVPSFADVYNTYIGFVWSMTRYLGVERGDLDDVVQEIFVIIHARLHTIEQPESLRSWIYSIIRRSASRYYRTKRTKLINTGTEPEKVPADLCTPQQMAETSEEVELLQSMLEKLDEPKREVFVLTEVEEMTAPEIAAAIGIPLNTVYSRLRAARQELEQALQRHQARIKK
jgi:RNA polymerase sigma-70 factor (ECF subfamily)